MMLMRHYLISEAHTLLLLYQLNLSGVRTLSYTSTEAVQQADTHRTTAAIE
jgi:hypothetical protein